MNLYLYEGRTVLDEGNSSNEGWLDSNIQGTDEWVQLKDVEEGEGTKARSMYEWNDISSWACWYFLTVKSHVYWVAEWKDTQKSVVNI